MIIAFLLVQGLEVRGSKYDGTNSESYGYLHDRGKKFIGIDRGLHGLCKL